MDSPQHASLCYSFLAPGLGDESLATQSTMIWILSSMNLFLMLYVVQRDETLSTQIARVLILPRCTFYVPLPMFPGDSYFGFGGGARAAGSNQIKTNIITQIVTKLKLREKKL